MKVPPALSSYMLDRTVVMRVTMTMAPPFSFCMRVSRRESCNFSTEPAFFSEAKPRSVLLARSCHQAVIWSPLHPSTIFWGIGSH